MSHRSELVRQLVERGFLHQATDLEGLDALALGQRITAYIGFDCTADSLHVGNLVGIMLLRLVQHTGHRPIALVGGGTTKVGDPSGKDESRQLLDEGDAAGASPACAARSKPFCSSATVRAMRCWSTTTKWAAKLQDCFCANTAGISRSTAC